MALVLKDRVQEVSTTSGTGTLTLTGAVSGFQTFSTAIGNGNTTYYTIFDSTAYVWEVGIGTVGAGTLARTTVLANSSGTTSALNLAGNTVFVFCTYPAERSINYDADNVATIGSTLGYSDTGIIASFASTVAGYNQVILQNKSTATNASTNFNVSNDAGTAGSNYAELGINSSTFTGSGSFNIAGASYVASASTDLTLGTYGAYSIHFVTNSSTTDAMTIFNNGGISLGGFSNPGIGNMAASKFVPGYTSVTAAGGTTTLTASSDYYQNLVGTTTQTFKLPDATGLLEGTTFIFDNDSTGTLTVVDNASGSIETVPSGAASFVYLADNATVAGTWRKHAFLPASYDFNATTANFGNATITNAVWNGTTIASGYGGTGLTTFTGANNALYSTNATTLVAGTLPIAAGGTAKTTFTANGVVYGDGTNPLGVTAAGTTGQVLIATTGSAPSWGAIPTTAAVTSFQTSLNGLTPSTATTGAVTLAGTLGVTSGGTGTSTSFTTGSVVFAGASGVYSQDNANFFWDNSNSRLGIGTASPTQPLDINGNLAITGNARRITGDFSNATIANRLMFQNSVVNANTNFPIIPNGTATQVGINLYNNSDPTNASSFNIISSSSENSIRAAISGTGTYLPMTFYTSGSERMRIDTSGNVGIGTTSPTTLLHLKSTGPAILTIEADSDNITETDNARIELSQDGGAVTGRIGYSSGTNSLEFWNNYAENLFFGTNNTERMRITSTGDVGIGTTTITGKFNVTGAAAGISGYFTDAVNSSLVIRNLSGGVTLGTDVGGAIHLATNGNTASERRLTIDSSGNVGIGTSSPSALLHVSNASARIRIGVDASSQYTDIFRDNATGYTVYNAAQAATFRGHIWQLGGTEAMRIDSSGNVGIGTASPAVKLDVIGSIKASPASTQDAVILAGRAGGTSSYAVTLTPTTLTASRTVTFPDANINFTTGLGTAQGGTGLTSYTTGDLIYASATNTLSKLTAGTNGYVLTLASGVPTWAASSGSMVYPSAGIAVSTGSAWGTSLTAPSGTIVGTSDSQTLTNKTISADNNTLSGIAASSFVLSNSSGNIDGAAAQKAIPSGAVVGTTDTQTLSGKTLTDPIITGTITEDVFTITDAAGFAIDPTNGSIQLITLGANRTPTQANWDAGEAITLMVNDGTAYTITWSTLGVVWVAGSAPTLATSGYTVIELWKVSTTIYGALVGSVA